MSKNPGKAAETKMLRRRAEAQIKRRGLRGSAVDATRMVHELQVHQVELEMQADELLRARDGMEALAVRYAELYDSATTGYFDFDAQGRIREVNRCGARLLGFDRARLARRRFESFVAAADRPAFGAFLGRVFSSTRKQRCELVLSSKTHAALVVRIEGVLSADKQECRAAVLDLAERKHSAEVLRSDEQQLRELSRRLQETETTERSAIADALHDRIGQGLATLGIMAGTLEAKLSRKSRSAVGMQLNQMQALLRSMVAEVRELMAELRPPVLDDYGLLAALRQLAGEFSARSGVAVKLSGVEPRPRLSPFVETALFRICREALSNVLERAQTKQVSINVKSASGRVVLQLAGDGIGFDAADATSDEGHRAMAGMRDAAAAAGIAFRLHSAPGAGTRITLEAERAAK